MKIYCKKTGKTYEASLRMWDNENNQYSEDMIDDQWNTLPLLPINEDHILATDDFMADVSWWEGECAVFNAGGQSEFFGTKDEKGDIEYHFDYDEIEQEY